MRISFVLAADKQNAIGAHGRIPWRMRTDLRRFKRLTMGHHLLMGRKTWESIGQALPGRVSLVVTRQEGYSAPGAIVFPSPQAGIAFARQAGERELFVVGGAQLYAALLPQAERIYLSRVHTTATEADTFFPLGFLHPPEWRLLSRQEHLPGEGDDCGHTFEVWERKTRLQEENAAAPSDGADDVPRTSAP